MSIGMDGPRVALGLEHAEYAGRSDRLEERGVVSHQVADTPADRDGDGLGLLRVVDRNRPDD